MKRVFDVLLSAFGLLVLLPLFVVVAVAVKLGDGGTVLFRQQRIGFRGREFVILKFRTMISHAAMLGPSITSGGDRRVTRVGRILRRTKLDELPQLWNVLCGDMSFVGPRPEVPRYVMGYSREQRAVLELRPGITDLASIVFRNEEELLRNAVDPERFYITCCVPRKIELNLSYARRANLWQDMKIILQTVFPPLAGSLQRSLTLPDPTVPLPADAEPVPTRAE